ncbi:hypothetical protein CBR_g22939 [Chara braunii]|uniref:Uncharacterized protein n=1 Tax=Chara braunii TaxID=69332 RepID=A0A388L337_CHABU|nr:hypothetical protein CBR_g22939 [Chara braunii]|eukprot:GBG76720.1 hypothetical protein CBR_g22939 [Chara braunii]
MMRGIMWNNTLLQAHLRTERQQRQKYQQDIAVLTTAICAEATQQQQQHQLLNSALARINSIEANASAAPGCTTDATKQLNERIDHVVTIIGDIGVFSRPDTISSTVAAIKTDITKLQTRPDAATKNYKMPHFDISKFDDYNKLDALTWWQRFLTEASCRTVPTDDMMKALYLQLVGGAQAWMNHLAATNKCTIADLHTHITWNEFEKLWFTRFMVRNVVKAAMNEVYTCSQGNMRTRDWTTKWQKMVTTPGFDLSFPNQRSEFFSRSCAGLRSALGNEYDYDTFQAILDRANLVIQTDDKAAKERQSQPHYVAKQGYQCPAYNNAVFSEEIDDHHAAAASSSDGGIVAALPPKRPKRVRKNKATQETTSTGTGQQPWTTYKITKDVYDLCQKYGYCLWCNSVTHVTAQCPEKGKAREYRLSQMYQDALWEIQRENYVAAQEIFECILRDPLCVAAQEEKFMQRNQLLHLRFLAFKNLAEVLIKKGDGRKSEHDALLCYLEAVRIYRQDVVVWHRLGILTWRLSLLSLARNAFEEGLACSPHHWGCMEKLLEVLVAIRDERACRRLAKRMLRCGPHSRASEVLQSVKGIKHKESNEDGIHQAATVQKVCGRPRISPDPFDLLEIDLPGAKRRRVDGTGDGRGSEEHEHLPLQKKAGEDQSAGPVDSEPSPQVLPCNMQELTWVELIEAVGKLVRMTCAGGLGGEGDNAPGGQGDVKNQAGLLPLIAQVVFTFRGQKFPVNEASESGKLTDGARNEVCQEAGMKEGGMKEGGKGSPGGSSSPMGGGCDKDVLCVAECGDGGKQRVEEKRAREEGRKRVGQEDAGGGVEEDAELQREGVMIGTCAGSVRDEELGKRMVRALRPRSRSMMREEGGRGNQDVVMGGPRDVRSVLAEFIVPALCGGADSGGQQGGVGKGGKEGYGGGDGRTDGEVDERAKLENRQSQQAKAEATQIKEFVEHAKGNNGVLDIGQRLVRKLYQIGGVGSIWEKGAFESLLIVEQMLRERLGCLSQNCSLLMGELYLEALMRLPGADQSKEWSWACEFYVQEVIDGVVCGIAGSGDFGEKSPRKGAKKRVVEEDGEGTPFEVKKRSRSHPGEGSTEVDGGGRGIQPKLMCFPGQKNGAPGNGTRNREACGEDDKVLGVSAAMKEEADNQAGKPEGCAEAACLGKGQRFWIRMHWFLGRFFLWQGNRDKAYCELARCFKLMEECEVGRENGVHRDVVCLPKWLAERYISKDLVTKKLREVELDWMVFLATSKIEDDHMKDQSMATEVVAQLAPALLGCTSKGGGDEKANAEDDGTGGACSSYTSPCTSPGSWGVEQGGNARRLNALRVLLSACEKAGTDGLTTALHTHIEILTLVCSAAGWIECDRYGDLVAVERKRGSERGEGGRRWPREGSKQIAEELKALSRCLVRIKDLANDKSESKVNVDITKLPPLAKRRLQQLLIACIHRLYNAPTLARRGFLRHGLNMDAQTDSAALVDAVVSFCRIQHLDPAASINQQVYLLMKMHELLADRGLCCSGKGSDGGEGAFLRMAIHQLTALEMKLKSQNGSVPSDPLLERRRKHIQEREEAVDRSCAVRCASVFEEEDAQGREAREGGDTAIATGVEQDRGSPGTTNVDVIDIDAPDETTNDRVKAPISVDDDIETQGTAEDEANDERKAAETALDAALDQCFFCLYGLNLRSSSDEKNGDGCVLHENTNRGDYQTEKQCEEVLHYVLPFVQNCSRNRLLKLRRVLRLIYKKFPTPPQQVLDLYSVDGFLDDPDLDERGICQELLDADANNRGESSGCKELAVLNKQEEKTGAKSKAGEEDGQGTARTEGPYVEVYSNLYYLLTQVEEMSASVQWAGFVLTKEGEEFVEHNSNLINYDLCYHPMRYESWYRMATLHDEAVDLLLNDGSKNRSVAAWRRNKDFLQRVEVSRRRSRRCLLKSLVLAPNREVQGEVQELLGLVYYDAIQNVVPLYDQRRHQPVREKAWRNLCENATLHFKGAFAKKPEWLHLFYLGKLSEKLGHPPGEALAFYKRASEMNPSILDPIYRLHASRMKLLCSCPRNDRRILKVVAEYCFRQEAAHMVEDLLRCSEGNITIDMSSRGQVGEREREDCESQLARGVDGARGREEGGMADVQGPVGAVWISDMVSTGAVVHAGEGEDATEAPSSGSGQLVVVRTSGQSPSEIEATAWELLFADCMEVMRMCVDADLKHFHRARYCMAKWLLRRGGVGEVERAKEELAFCFRTGRSPFTINMWEIDDNSLRRNRRGAKNPRGPKGGCGVGGTRRLEPGLSESSRKFITCVRKYLLLYLSLCEQTSDLATLERAYSVLRVDKRFCLCLEDIAWVALGRYLHGLVMALQKWDEERERGNWTKQQLQTAGQVQIAGPGSHSANAPAGLLERAFTVFLEHSISWEDTAGLGLAEAGYDSVSTTIEEAIYRYGMRYLDQLEEAGDVDTLELVNEKMRRKFKSPKLTSAGVLKMYRRAALCWFHALSRWVSQLSTPAAAPPPLQLPPPPAPTAAHLLPATVLMTMPDLQHQHIGQIQSAGALGGPRVDGDGRKDGMDIAGGGERSDFQWGLFRGHTGSEIVAADVSGAHIDVGFPHLGSANRTQVFDRVAEDQYDDNRRCGGEEYGPADEHVQLSGAIVGSYATAAENLDGAIALIRSAYALYKDSISSPLANLITGCWAGSPPRIMPATAAVSTVDGYLCSGIGLGAGGGGAGFTSDGNRTAAAAAAGGGGGGGGGGSRGESILGCTSASSTADCGTELPGTSCSDSQSQGVGPYPTPSAVLSRAFVLVHGRYPSSLMEAVKYCEELCKLRPKRTPFFATQSVATAAANPSLPVPTAAALVTTPAAATGVGAAPVSSVASFQQTPLLLGPGLQEGRVWHAE